MFDALLELELGLNGPTLVLVGIAGLAITGAVSVFTRGASIFTKIALFTALSIGASAAYFGYVQRRAGISEDIVADPTDLLDEAEKIKREAEKRNREILRTLKDLEKQRKRAIPKDE